MSNGSSSNRPRSWDDDMCFHIRDFDPGDSILVRKDDTIPPFRGVVEQVDYRNMLIKFQTKDGNGVASLNEIAGLMPPVEGWL